MYSRFMLCHMSSAATGRTIECALVTGGAMAYQVASEDRRNKEDSAGRYCLSP